jgi:hypothetical protein
MHHTRYTGMVIEEATWLITFKVHEDTILPAPRPVLAADITF